jgi:uncharacterized membrane protein YbaN (DUF454 family)
MLIRGGFLVLGLIFSGLGWIGVVVPGMPATIFFILALWAFKKSSPPLEAWLLNNRVIGPTLRNWEESRSMTRRAKVLAISLIWVSIGASSLLIGKLWVKLMLLATAAALTVFLATRKTAPSLDATDHDALAEEALGEQEDEQQGRHHDSGCSHLERPVVASMGIAEHR